MKKIYIFDINRVVKLEISLIFEAKLPPVEVRLIEGAEWSFIRKTQVKSAAEWYQNHFMK